MTRRIQTLDGLPVYDATEPMWIEVQAQDVNKNRRRDPERCALAAACTRSLHVEARAYLSRLYIRQEGGPSEARAGGYWLRYMLPEAIRSEVATFDRGGGFSSGTYRIPPLPPKVRGPDGIKGGKTKNPNRGTGNQRITHRDVKGVRSPSPLFGGAIEQKD